jgi:hypothetical protein
MDTTSYAGTAVIFPAAGGWKTRGHFPKGLEFAPTTRHSLYNGLWFVGTSATGIAMHFVFHPFLSLWECVKIMAHGTQTLQNMQFMVSLIS